MNRSVKLLALLLVVLCASYPAFGQCVTDTCTSCGSPPAGQDGDSDTIPDLLEYDLAYKFFPSLKLQYLDVDLDESYAYLGRTLPYTVHPVQPNGVCDEVNECLELRFGLAYKQDHGDDYFHFVDNGHPGDSEFYAAVVIRTTSWATASSSASYWTLIRDFTAAHWNAWGDSSMAGAYGDQGCEQWSYYESTCRAHGSVCTFYEGGCFGTPSDPKYTSCNYIFNGAQCYYAGCSWLEPLCSGTKMRSYATTRLAGPPVLYASERKHGTYHTDGECEDGGLYSADACPANQHDLRNHIWGRLQNVGNASCNSRLDRSMQHPNFCNLYEVWGGARFAESTPYRDNFSHVFDWALPGANQATPAPVLPSACSGNPFSYPTVRAQYLACYGLAGHISSNCRDIPDLNDRQMCYAMSDHTQTPCTQMNDRNLQLACYGMSVAPNYPSNCRDITDPALQQFCYGVAGRNTGYCAGLADADSRQLCNAMATGDSSYCASVSAAADRWFCYGVSTHNNSYCANIQLQ